jgi:UDPglucose 6-dehydrogenase
LLQKGAIVRVFDPRAERKASQVLTDKVIYASTLEECLTSADCCVIATEWREFQNITLQTVKKLMKSPVIIDGRRILDPKDFKDVYFYAIGLSQSKPSTDRGLFH